MRRTKVQHILCNLSQIEEVISFCQTPALFSAFHCDCSVKNVKEGCKGCCQSSHQKIWANV